jgi:hypothetical protein
VVVRSKCVSRSGGIRGERGGCAAPFGEGEWVPVVLGRTLFCRELFSVHC